jgi:hypothetical protein
MKSGVSKTLLLREIEYQHKLNFVKHCKAVFGSYCEAHKEPIPSNNMDTHSIPAIVLGPKGNQQGALS